MENKLPTIFRGAQRISRLALVFAIFLLLTARLVNLELSLGLQILIALVALCIGIPHGAIDHLILIPSKPRRRFFGFIIVYIAVALLAAWALVSWNLPGFRVVVLMSALHFGFGDAAYRNEWCTATGRSRSSLWVATSYAIPAGFIPVILPLTDYRSLSALQQINPKLIDWAGSGFVEIRHLTLAVAGIAFLLLLLTGHSDFALDLLLLTLLSIVAPPLISFAIYFGLWHALRHTARLIPKLPPALHLALKGDVIGAIKLAVFPGLYAVGGTLAISAGLLIGSPRHFTTGLLWWSLVIVWSLTVPHMIATSRFDWVAIKIAR